MKFKTFAFLALAALTTAFASKAQATDLVITKIMVNPNGGTDDDRGLEGWEVKNVGGASVDLAAEGIAIVSIENEAGQHGELDSFIQLTGTLPAGQSVLVRDTKSNGTLQTLTSDFGSSLTTIANTSEFFSGHGSTDLSNSGDNFILVKGFHASNINPHTSAVYNFLDQLDLDDDGILDFQDTVTTSDDLWDSQLDAVVVAPDPSEASSWTDYTAAMSIPHKVVGVANTDWTGDCFLRLQNQDTGAYDQCVQMDILAPSSNIIKNDIADSPVQFNLMSHASFTVTGTGSVPGTVRYEFSYGQYNNLTDWSGFTGLTIGGHLYKFI